MRIAGFCVMMGLMLVGGCTVMKPGPAEPVAGTQPAELTSVFGVERPADHDIMVLRDGRKIEGRLINSSFSLFSAYGRIDLGKDVVAGLDLRMNADGVRSVITINRDRFSGFFEDESIRFRGADGTEYRENLGHVARVVLGRQNSFGVPIERNRFVMLRNGDFFSGAIVEQEVLLKTAAGLRSIRLDEANTLRFGGATGVVQAVMLDGKTISGWPVFDTIQLRLDVAGTATLHRDLISVLYCKKGFFPSKAKPQAPVVAPAPAPEPAPVQAPPAPVAVVTPAPTPAPEPVEEKTSGEFPNDSRAPGTKYKNRQAAITFENCPADVGTAYAGVTFTGSWRAWEPPNADYKLNGKVASGGADARIAFGSPCSKVELIGTSPQTTTTIVALDSAGNEVGKSSFTGVDKLVEVGSGSANISTVQIRGEPNQWVIDDIQYR